MGIGNLLSIYKLYMIVATNKDKHGKIHKSKKMHEGNCEFPFKYNRKLHTECIEGKNGDWCATQIDSDKKMLKYGYCQSNNDNLKEIHADLININGNKNVSKKFKAGKCIFPFKYYGKMRKECINSKKG